MNHENHVAHTAIEAAIKIGLSERTIREAIKRGDLEATKTPRGAWAIDGDELERFHRHYTGVTNEGG